MVRRPRLELGMPKPRFYRPLRYQFRSPTHIRDLDQYRRVPAWVKSQTQRLYQADLHLRSTGSISLSSLVSYTIAHDNKGIWYISYQTNEMEL